ncbi:ABC transporter permease [Faecalibaculum rodentium]|uniref:ABC transporter permease n=1 Tax=Faecalibaculum rodentium TaxID=1702221 RepID=UPI002676CE49|nr:ABC transporter permease [Faecalibaculum rodentium]
MQLFKNLYAYRELLKTNIKKDIRGRYKGSFLGVLWSFINPLLQVVVYWIVFPYLMGRAADGENYLIYLITGLIPWTFFLTTVSGGTTVIKANSGIIKKVYFPREILPISTVASGLVNFFISCVIIVLFLLGSGVGVAVTIIQVPVIALVEAMLALGIVFILSALDAYIQDIENIVQFILNMMLYGSPIIYHLSQFSNAGLLYRLISLNPMTVLINAYRDAFMYHTWVNWESLGMVALLSLILVIIGYNIFRKLEKGFAEKL